MRDIATLRQKVEEVSYKAPEGMTRVPWIETLQLSNAIVTTEFNSAEDSVKIEKAMHDATLLSVKEGYRRLAAMNVPATRPNDFMAEMLRDDTVMSNVKAKLAEEAAKIKSVETRKRVQAEKKFVKKGVTMKAPPKKEQSKNHHIKGEDEYTPLAHVKIAGKGQPDKTRAPKKRFNNDKRGPRGAPQKEAPSRGGSSSRGGKGGKVRKDLFKGNKGGKGGRQGGRQGGRGGKGRR